MIWIDKHKRTLQTILPILLASLLFSQLLGHLYRHDNKYTDDSLQPISGLLVLDESDFVNSKIYYLTQGWQFYPGVLLTPQDFANCNTPDAYMQTISIGKTNNFNLHNLNSTTGGSATYHLTLALPDKETIYSLVLAEIFSSYRLYINGVEISSVGVPEAAGFTELVSRKTVTFSTSGNTELLIAVSNRSHFYDGMTYPPIFGLSEAVSHLESTRLILGVITFVLSLLCTILSLYLLVAFRGRRDPKITWFFYSSICITITYLYPLLFHSAEISPSLWYGVELLAIYGSYFFAVMLQNEICGIEPMPKKISRVILAVFCAFALFYGLLPIYTVWLIKLFGVASTIIKILTMAYLLFCAIQASLREQPSSRLLLFCTTAFGVSILYDRLYSGWEPICGGWPIEYGYAVLILGFSMILWQDLSEGYLFKLTFAEEKRQLTRQVAIQKAHYLELTDKIEDTVRMRHDERHHLQTLYSIYENKDYDRLGKYLSDYVLTSIPNSRTVLCKNMIVDSILRYYETLCQQENIIFSCSTTLAPNLPIPDVELSILFGNLLENAYEAAIQPGYEKPFVSFRVKQEHHSLLLLIENSFVTPVRKKADRLLSTKHDGYGIGTQSIRSVVDGYNGSCTFSDQNGVFTVTILMHLNSN
ncbi:MAG: GHKL domain-containing protein [Lachnospiraceae bacterium]